MSGGTIPMHPSMPVRALRACAARAGRVLVIERGRAYLVRPTSRKETGNGKTDA